ncbi:ATP-binding protein [Glycomyces sp. NPDC046736]|uniref:AAA family ATPase n=1 Tax=Glycomyces sp. NPDC046736 TaxID=3155615 RepID=UPI0033F29860
MPKPPDMFDREREWSALGRFVGSGQSSATLGVVSGRRRQGKTFLLEALSEVTGGLFIAAEQASEAESLRSFAAAVGAFARSPLPVAFEDWRQAIDALLAIGADREVSVVIDEFPYLVRASPQLPSIIQAALAPRRPEFTSSRTRLLLCGSAMSFMGGLLAGNAPLRGRAGLELVVPTLDYRLAADFWGIDDPLLAFKVNSVVGGTPAYRRQFTADDAPASLGDFDAWMLRHPLNPASPLFREARYLLSEESDIRDPGLYHSVLAAVTAGNATTGGIGGFVGRKAGDVAHPLHVLEDAGLLRRETDAFRQNRTVYRVNEPLIAFHQAVLRPSWTDWERGRDPERLWARAQPRFSSQVLGPRFEQVCREWARHFAEEEDFGGFADRVASGTVNDPGNRTAHEVDVAVFTTGDGGGERLLAIGEAKLNETVGLAHLERLEHIRGLLSRRYDTSRTRLALFSGSEFAPSLRSLRREDVVLVDLPRLYGR